MTTAIILAGGLGTRLRNVVPDLPKPMAPIGGRPFLAHQMDFWIGQGVRHFILSVGYKKEKIIDYFGPTYRNIPLTYAVEEKPLGTGGALFLAAQGIEDTFLLLNGDTFFDVDFSKLMKFHEEKLSDLTLALFRTREVGRYMRVDIDVDGHIQTNPSRRCEWDYLSNGGVYLIEPSALTKLSYVQGEYRMLESDIFPSCAALGVELYGLEFSGGFIDIGVPRDYFRAAEIMAE